MATSSLFHNFVIEVEENVLTNCMEITDPEEFKEVLKRQHKALEAKKNARKSL